MQHFELRWNWLEYFNTQESGVRESGCCRITALQKG
jgi:hypothetical protein